MKKALLSLPNIIKAIRPTAWITIGCLMIFFPLDSLGQKKCTNPPTLNLSQLQGSTCTLTPITISNNTFGGSADLVTISSNGSGKTEPVSAATSPFSFTYTPAGGDDGHIVTIVISTNDPPGSCKPANATFTLMVGSGLQAPQIVRVDQPTCTTSTGTVSLGGLPTYSPWMVTVNPGGQTIQGTGESGTVDNLLAGDYTFTVSLSDFCFSAPSAGAVIAQQPGLPAPPGIRTITAPTCLVATGSVSLSGLPATGSWTLTRYPGTIATNGTGTEFTLTGLPTGTYNFNVTTAEGCTSSLSGTATIPLQPPVPQIPVIDTIIEPTVDIITGSVTLSNLPPEGTWKITRSPGNVVNTGTGIMTTIGSIATGTYTFRVTNSSGCISPESEQAEISLPSNPTLMITDPPSVCEPGTADLTAPGITKGSTKGLTLTYWYDAKATIPLEDPSSVPGGTYYIKGTATWGLSDIQPVTASVLQTPVAYAGPDQSIGFQHSTELAAVLDEGERGRWHSDSSEVVIADPFDPTSAVSNLSSGLNTLSWIVTNGVCPSDTDKVIIDVGEIMVSTLITPNGDFKNEQFIVEGLESLGKTELTIFDRRGKMLYRNNNYDNSWNGVDYNDEPLISDTYFYVLKSSSGKSYSGFIVLKR